MWRQAEVCLRPLPHYGRDRASRPPPLQHRVPIRAAQICLRSASILASAYPDHSGAFSVLGLGESSGVTPGIVLLSLTAPRLTYEPTLRNFTADIARRRDSGMLATPDSFRLNQNPLGAIHLPQALTFVDRSVAGESFGSSGRVELSSALAASSFDPFHPCGIPSYKVSLPHCFRFANAFAARRQAEVCLRPLSRYGRDRASRPPPLQHRVPIRAAWCCLRNGPCSRQLDRITPEPFQSRGRANLRANLRFVFFELHSPQTYV